MPGTKRHADAAITKASNSMKRKKKSPGSKEGKSKEPSHQSTFPFLNLPGEIRNEIYRYSLTQEPAIKIKANEAGKVSRDSRTKGQKPLNSSLLLVNRQISNEAGHILYTENNFHGYTAGSLADFAHAIGSNASLIRTITMHIEKIRGAALARAGFYSLNNGANLRLVRLDCGQDVHQPHKLATRFYNAARPWLDHVTAHDGKVSIELYNYGPLHYNPSHLNTWKKVVEAFGGHLAHCMEVEKGAGTQEDKEGAIILCY